MTSSPIPAPAPSSASSSPSKTSTKRKLAPDADEAGTGTGTGAGVASTKTAKAKAKKRRKEQEKAQDNPPSFSFDTRGFNGGRHIGIKDVRDLVLHLLADEKAQQWLYVANKRHLSRVVLLQIPGILPPSLGLPSSSLPSSSSSQHLPFPLSSPSPSPSHLPILQSLFSHALPVKAPGEKSKLHSCYQHLVCCPLSQGEKSRREEKRKLEAREGIKAAGKNGEWMIMSEEELGEFEYPRVREMGERVRMKERGMERSGTWDEWRRDDGWIECPLPPLPSSSSTNGMNGKEKGGRKRTMLAIDCEMCLTSNGSELARVSVVDRDGKRIYDTLVKPDSEIKDYLTRYSGLTKEKMENVTTTLVDVQKELTKLISHDTILIGHSLECDLRVLKLAHPHIIDTSNTYHHPRGPPFKASLKWLAQKWLKKEIQQVGSSTSSTTTALETLGHDSEEDARTALELVLLKMEKGRGFGEFVSEQETIFERVRRFRGSAVEVEGEGEGIGQGRSVVVDHGNPASGHGGKADKVVGCGSDEEVLEGLKEEVGKHDLAVGRFMALSHALGWSQPYTTIGRTSTTLPGIPASALSTPLEQTPPTPSESDLTSIYSTLNSQIASLHASLPPRTALIILTSHGDPREVVRLTQKKAKFDRLWKTVKQSEIVGEDRWLEEDDRALVEGVEKCRNEGMAFFCIK